MVHRTRMNVTTISVRRFNAADDCATGWVDCVGDAGITWRSMVDVTVTTPFGGTTMAVTTGATEVAVGAAWDVPVIGAQGISS